MDKATRNLKRMMDEAADVQTCRACGKVGPKESVQPQEDGGALCDDCRNRMIMEAREARKLAREASALKCEACGKVGTVKVGAADGAVVLCGRCLKRLEAERTKRLGALAGVALSAGMTMTRATIRELAGK